MTALEKILVVMRDGEARTVTNIYFLTGVSPNTVRRALANGDLIKVGEAPNPVPPARRGQAIVRIAQKHENNTCQHLSNVA